ncbi:glutathione peroxidase [Segatella paludivivens]|uniref:glutathione peroxidase n=1 Tax=Segatella paludivivens TaxID=185294 RepID=UPI000380EDC9|nr:glutathione peroxidase [Segatella paludivivens]
METKNFYDFTVKNKKGESVSLAEYKGKVVLIVNIATKCGFTPQLTGLEELCNTYQDKGLVILGFPCNQFANQNPGSDDQTQEFCSLNYGVTFPIMKKINVNGNDADPLYKWLKSKKGGILWSAIKWNFTKFLINKNGEVVHRFSPTASPSSLEKYIVNEL